MIQPVSINNPYVYIDSLNTTAPEIWEQAVKTVNECGALINGATAQEKIDLAINFLYQVANQQQANELAFINNQIQKLENYSKEIEIPELLNLKKSFEKLNPETGIDYKKMSSLLNKVLTTTENYKSRLKSLKDNIKKNNESNRNKGLLEDIDKEFKTTIKFLEEDKKQLQRNVKDYSKIMPFIVSEYIKNNRDKITSLNPHEFSAILLKLEIDFRKFLEQKKQLKNPSDETLEKREKYLKKQFNSFMKKYEGNYFSMPQNDIDWLVKTFNITVPSEGKIKNSTLNYSFLSNFQNDSLYDPAQDVSITITSNIKPSIIAEKLSLIIGNFDIGKHSGSSNMGNDVILGSINARVSIDPKTNQKAINALDQTIEEMNTTIKNFSVLRTDRENFKKNIQEMNESIEEKIVKLDQFYKEENLEGFIIHESTKYYQEIEKGFTGRWDSITNTRSSGFSGRTLSILNYIDTMTTIGIDFGIDPKYLYFAGINLGEHSPAHGMLNTLENIFSIAASLIMFDDASFIYKEAIEELTTSNITNLHLYNLQGLYFPSSYIIKQSAIYLTNLKQEFSQTNDAATVTISTPTNPIKDYIKSAAREKDQKAFDKRKKRAENFKNLSSEQQWNTIRDYVSSNTKVSIHFFLNFQNFINNMP